MIHALVVASIYLVSFLASLWVMDALFRLKFGVKVSIRNAEGKLVKYRIKDGVMTPVE